MSLLNLSVPIIDADEIMASLKPINIVISHEEIISIRKLEDSVRLNVAATNASLRALKTMYNGIEGNEANSNQAVLRELAEKKKALNKEKSTRMTNSARKRLDSEYESLVLREEALLMSRIKPKPVEAVEFADISGGGPKTPVKEVQDAMGKLSLKQ